MPEKLIYAMAGGGTVLSGVTYKWRIGQSLKPFEWAVLVVSLFLFGLIAFSILGYYFHEPAHQEARLGLSILLGVGMSETFTFFIAALQKLIEYMPEELKVIMKSRWGGKR